MDSLLGLFSVPWESPSLAAELARYRAWATPVENEIAVCPALVKVIKDYPLTADARRALLDISGIYMRRGDRVLAEAPFRYVMEVRRGEKEARIARLRLIEMYRCAGAPEGVDIAGECRQAIAAFAGTPEEGMARTVLAEVLFAAADNGPAVAEYERVLQGSLNEPYVPYVRIGYAEALTASGRPGSALKAIAPALTDQAWGGRAHLARAHANRLLRRKEAAIADYRAAGRTADSVSIRGIAYRELAQMYADNGQLSQARECLQECLAVDAFRSDRMDIEVEIMRDLLAERNYAKAAQAAFALQMEVLNVPEGRYKRADLDTITRECTDTIADCEQHLAEGKQAR